MRTTKRFTRPIFLRFTTEEDEKGSSDGTGSEDGKPAEGGDLGFPANTPIKEMTDAQQAAYWRHNARKHEKNRKPDNFTTLEDEARQWREHQESVKTPEQKVSDAALAAARTEGAETLLHDAIRAELRARRPHMTIEKLDELLEDVALSKFMKDGALDTDRIDRLADKLAPADGEGDDKAPKPPSLGDVLGHSKQPPAGGAGSVASYQAVEAQRYSTTTK